MTTEGEQTQGRTSWGDRLHTPLRQFFRTESGSALVLFAAAIAALIWVNVDQASYESVWHTMLSVRLGGQSIDLDLQRWVNSGLMALFFFVVGLEARREFDVGELRERQRVTLPLLAGIAGMTVPAGIYLAFNAGHGSALGWGAAISTDTAFALGMLTIVGPRFSDRLRSFMLTVLVVDDLIALVVIAIAYSTGLSAFPLAVAIAVFAALLGLLALKVRLGLLYGAFGCVIWVALLKSGVDPVVVGLAMGLVTYAYPADRSALERAAEGFRSFREQPTAKFARQARETVEAAISPNDRLRQRYHPWTSYLIVPLFALANVGIPLNLGFVADAFTSPVTLGIVVGYVVGKPVGIITMSWLVARSSGGRLRPPVGWMAVAGSGAIAGIGFTVSLLIASLALRGTQLQQAKLGVLAAAVASSMLAWLVFKGVQLLPPRRRVIALLGRSETIVDLADPVDPERDHIRGPADALVTLVEYGDLECPYCGRAEPVVRELLADFGDLRYVWRHLPLTGVHPHAQLAAEATEAAGMQATFWSMHDLLFQHQDQLTLRDLVRYAGVLGLDVDRFTSDLARHAGAARVARDVDSADVSGVTGTPTFFVNGHRHRGVFDIDSLAAAVRAARARATIMS